jgi:hypothetical protein
MPQRESDPSNTTSPSREAEAGNTTGTGGGAPSAFRFEGNADGSTGRSGQGQAQSKRQRATGKIARESGKQFKALQTKSAEKVRQFAETGKGRVDENLDAVIELADRGAQTIEERYGEEYGRYARKAADYVTSFAGNIRNKNVDDLLEDSRTFVRQNGLTAVLGAVLAGFVATRIVRAGLDEDTGEEIQTTAAPVAINSSTTFEGVKA